ncbi:unnamed protein product [Aphanomyces euteiches]|uniref:Uncharacterized protein n=1 Tax=Aphanomyces euteiches TaxID=100861 RepID=A0A6G0WQC8_9STRA|nr:hypothetical protein Ae201684_012844 [Aphanomyces euteiches]KAH9145300.1 hypothetical protein AeRB84_010794 [Aphanomyces euteiches]
MNPPSGTPGSASNTTALDATPLPLPMPSHLHLNPRNTFQHHKQVAAADNEPIPKKSQRPLVPATRNQVPSPTNKATETKPPAPQTPQGNDVPRGNAVNDKQTLSKGPLNPPTQATEQPAKKPRGTVGLKTPRSAVGSNPPVKVESSPHSQRKNTSQPADDATKSPRRGRSRGVKQIADEKPTSTIEAPNQERKRKRSLVLEPLAEGKEGKDAKAETTTGAAPTTQTNGEARASEDMAWVCM